MRDLESVRGLSNLVISIFVGMVGEGRIREAGEGGLRRLRNLVGVTQKEIGGQPSRGNGRGGSHAPGLRAGTIEIRGTIGTAIAAGPPGPGAPQGHPGKPIVTTEVDATIGAADLTIGMGGTAAIIEIGKEGHMFVKSGPKERVPGDSSIEKTGPSKGNRIENESGEITQPVMNPIKTKEKTKNLRRPTL